ncbi:MAG: ATP-binding cassette domain-containing protein, partial [Roseiarcus sp.]
MSEPSSLLDISDIAKNFGSVVALRAASLSVRAGEVHALMGANGAGKSTLVKILTGVFPADGGTITLAGQPRAFRSPAEARRAGIVSVYQDPALVPDLTVAQNLRLAKVPLPAVVGWLSELGVDGLDLKSYIRDLPYPMLRLIDLARALASEPKLLLLDEITAALSADLAEKVFAMVRRRRERGHAVIFISHRMAEVAALCDRATVLRDGITVGVTDTAEGSEERIVTMMLGTEIAKAIPRATHARPERAPAPGAPALEVRSLRCG